jgi:starch synthase
VKPSPGETPSVEVVTAYRFYMYELARQLEMRNALRQLHTALPARLIPEVSRRFVRSRPQLAAPRHVLGRAFPTVDRYLNRAVLADLDRWAARGLRGAPVVTALSACGTATLRRAADRGARTVCDRGSWHILEQKAVIERESERWGVPGPSFDNWIVERELEDYEIADRIFVPSTVSARSFFRRGFSSTKVRVVPFGADLRVAPPEDSRNRLSIICVGQVDLRKGHQYLVAAYRSIRRQGTSLRLVGPINRPFLDWLRILEDDIEVMGPVSRSCVMQEMTRAGIFALASVEEGLALVIPQAMSCGLPVVATDATGVADLIDDGVEGFIVNTADEDALAKALQALLNDPQRALAMGRAARNKIESLKGWHAYGDRALAEFASVTNK